MTPLGDATDSKNQKANCEFFTFSPWTGAQSGCFSFTSQAEQQEILAKIQRYETKIRPRFAELENSRRASLKALAVDLRSQSRDLARTLHEEMGKSVTEALAEIKKSAAALEYFAELKWKLSEPLKALGPGQFELRAEPLGFVLAIMPWNFPVWQFVRVLAPQILLGNGVLWKPSLVTPRTAVKLMELISRSGMAELVDLLFLPNEQVAAWIEQPGIKGVTFTGSTRAGREVAACAGRALKKVVLELGGSDPFIVCESADINRAAEAAVSARTQNWGQSCIAAKRFLIFERFFEDFKNKFIEIASEIEPQPLVSARAAELAWAQIEKFKKAGAVFIGANRKVESSSLAFPAGLLQFDSKQADLAMLIREEELFCPVGLITPFSSAEEALGLANDTEYGLGASVWTEDATEKELFKCGLRCGHIAFNDFTKSDPAVPFGGLGWSGFGKELGELGLREFCHFKAIKLS